MNETFKDMAALCLDPDEGELSVTAALPLDLADVESLSGVVESLVNTAEEWRRNAIAFLDVDEEASMNESEEDSVPLQAADPDALAGVVADLVETAARWRERLGSAF